MNTPSAALNWNCPKCGRVQNEVSSCRCGAERPLGRPLLLELIVVLALAAAGFVAAVLYVTWS